ncbi:MAG: GNAT family N-acetyltransferase [Candidatus Dormibacteraeota bacterium]|nr:GNAT family N-acetyltransferase [Candidatus Dormibacteraeota bacterium]
MTVSLRRPTPDEYATWSVVALEEYIDEIVASGAMSREAAETKARQEDAEVLPEGLNTPRQLIFRIEADGQSVGWLWLALDKPVPVEGVGYLYDINVDEEFRGRGYGRAAMLLAEEEAQRHGLRAIALNVFGQNTVARALYASLGYRETSVQMRKEL